MNLTFSASLSNLMLSINRSAGRGNPFLQGEKSPQPIAAFLCLSFSAALCRVYSVMAGCFGHPLRMAAPCSGISTPLQPVAHAVESMDDGYPRLQGSPL
jgi:hypothetical protein